MIAPSIRRLAMNSFPISRLPSSILRSPALRITPSFSSLHLYPVRLFSATPSSSSSTGNSAPSPSGASSSPPPFPPHIPSRRIPLFNTYRLVEMLKEAGLTEKQAVVVMEALITATSESLEATQASLNSSSATFATKSDYSSLKTELNEKLFNASLKYDLQQKHLREMFVSEHEALKNDAIMQMRAIKSDMQVQVKNDVSSLLTALDVMRKEIESTRSEVHEKVRAEVSSVETKITRWVIGGIATFVTSLVVIVITAAIRLMPLAFNNNNATATATVSSIVSSPPSLPSPPTDPFSNNYPYTSNTLADNTFVPTSSLPANLQPSTIPHS